MIKTKLFFTVVNQKTKDGSAMITKNNESMTSQQLTPFKIKGKQLFINTSASYSLF